MSPTQSNRSNAQQDYAPRLQLLGYPLNLFSEDQRLKTFSGWPSNAITPEELARYGFYYSGVNDLTKCAFCGLEVGEWVPGDSAAEDHKKFSPNCDFVRGRPCGNIPKGSSLRALCTFLPGSDQCGIYGFVIRPHSGPEQGMVDLANDFARMDVNRAGEPMHRSYLTLESRLATFQQWPATAKMRPQDLAAAGFYSIGCNDHVVCFYCGGGLKDWEEGDDAWIEHARWFSKCGFVTLHKGPDFISQACLSGPALLPVSTVNNLLQDEAAGQAASAPPEDVAPRNPTLPEDKSELEMCKVCFIAERSVLLVPCGHVVVCADCASALPVCPVCRKPIKRTMRAYLS